MLIVVMLLLAWLLLLQRRKEDEPVRERRKRATPVTAEQLGRAVFQAAVLADLEAYRGLFMMAVEAEEVLGPDAEAYLQRCGSQVLAESLATMAAMIPDGSQMGQVEVSGDNTLTIEVKPPGKEAFFMGVGTFHRMGRIYRLKEPAFT